MELLAQAEPLPGLTGDPVEIVLFWVFAVMALGSGIAVISMRNIVHGALMLVINLMAVAGLYVTLESPFLGIIQVLVYGGAIMVLFLFVIMLLGIDRDDLLLATHMPSRVLAVVGVALLAGALLLGFVGPYTSDLSLCNQPGVTGLGSSEAVPCQGLEQAVEEHERGSVGILGQRLFTRYTFPFELAAILLTVATIGATVIGRRRDLPPDDPEVVLPEELEEPEAPVGVGEEPETPVGAVDEAARPADHDLPERPTRDREV